MRYIKEAFFERAHQRHRPFDQRSHFVEQAWRHDGGAFLQRRQFGHAFGNQLTALVEVRQYVGFAQVFKVVGGRGDTHAFRVVEAVTTGVATGFLRKDRAVDHFIAQQHDQPLGRTYEFFLARAPAHALWNWQVIQ